MTSPAPFVHLRVHSAYSLLEGAIHPKAIAVACRKLGMPAVAITDTDNLFGALEFSQACAGLGVQPIVGCQIRVAQPDAGEGQRPRGTVAALDGGSLVLLVQNEEGYRNLIGLVSAAYMDSDESARPQLPLGAILARSAGLIALTGGVEGPLGRLLADGQQSQAETMLTDLKAGFPGRLYMEIQRHGMALEGRLEPQFLDLAYAHDVPLVATNEVYFLDAATYDAHDALLAVADGAFVSQSERRRLTPEHRLRSGEDMQALFADLPEAVSNTLVIAQRTAFMVEPRQPILPAFPVEAGRTVTQEIRAQSEAGLEQRLAHHVYPGIADGEREGHAKPYRERLDYELGVIEGMGYAGYFLIVAEFIQWAKDNGIPVGPGRGSGAGSVVAWALKITDLDPLRWGLLFERFLNPERVSMPDFDVDFCQDRRDEVIHHVQDLYGRDRVAQIITFGKLQARAVLRDVGRVLEMPYSQVDRICKLVPNNPANPVTLDQAIEGEPVLRQMIADDPQIERLIDYARRLEGLYRHASTHAAGVVIGDRPLDQLIPLYRDPRSQMPVTGFNMKYVEQAGLVKFDFLGLKTLTVLTQAVDLLASRGIALDLSALPLDDQKTFQMIGRGDTTGVFQLESQGMRDVLRKLKPDTFEDIIAVVALYRPGPMDNIPSYIRRKHGEEKPDYLDPTLEGILKETFGIMIYQEQVMQIAQTLAGFTLGSADLLRRAMGKKIKAEMDQQREVFVSGAVARGVAKGRAADIFEQVAKFAGYGFNKSHAAAYAMVAYQTAYMKANHPVEFLAASMTLDMASTDKLNSFRQELDRMGIPLLAPDINRSGAVFTVDRADDGRTGIRYALAAIRNVGRAAMEQVVAERERGGPFADLAQLAARIDPRSLNKRQVENLARAGAFDAINPNRRQAFEAAEEIVRRAAAAASERDSGQMGLFGKAADSSAPLRLSPGPDWAPIDRLGHEFEAIGFYLSAHPLHAYGQSLRRIRARTIAEVMAEGRSGLVNLAGTVIAKKERTSGKGNRFAFVQLSDTSGMFEIAVFAELLAQCRDILEPGQSLFIKGSAQFEGESVRLTAATIEQLDKVAARAAGGLRIVVDAVSSVEALKAGLGAGAGASAGKGAGGGNGGRGGQIILVSRLDPITEVEIALPGRYALSAGLLRTVRAIPGILDVQEI